MAKEGEEVFFVGLQSPEDLRRDLLESTKDVITVLRTYENFKKNRVDKAQHVLRLKETIKELDVLFAKLKRVLPKTRLREKAKSVSTKSKDEMELEKKNSKKPASEIEMLEIELADIEHKL